MRCSTANTRRHVRFSCYRETVTRACPTCSTPHDRNHAYCLDCHADYVREWRKSHPLSPEQRRRDNARSYANVYLKRGKLTREPCKDCGVEHDPPIIVVQMHHPDYSKPLDVTWLCTECHQDRHNHERDARVEVH